MGGRGLLSLDLFCNTQIEGVRKYFLSSSTSYSATGYLWLHWAIIRADQDFTSLALVREIPEAE